LQAIAGRRKKKKTVNGEGLETKNRQFLRTRQDGRARGGTFSRRLERARDKSLGDPTGAFYLTRTSTQISTFHDGESHGGTRMHPHGDRDREPNQRAKFQSNTGIRGRANDTRGKEAGRSFTLSRTGENGDNRGRKHSHSVGGQRGPEKPSLSRKKSRESRTGWSGRSAKTINFPGREEKKNSGNRTQTPLGRASQATNWITSNPKKCVMKVLLTKQDP